ncbi:MAG: TetR/AcrR family transcriptional regulator [Actinomycetota bacterium]|nr:TetR/AcrR family transcriptional regulator [Actinomycetota bacterium]
MTSGDAPIGAAATGAARQTATAAGVGAGAAPGADAEAAPGADPVPGSAAWWAARDERATRRRPRADGITVERIVDVAIRLVDDEGLAALTVRRIGDELGTGSASLYRHVASREELIVLMVDQVIGEVDLPDPELPARERMAQLAHELRRVLLDHAALLPALTAAPLLGPNALRGSEVGLVSALDAGHPPEVATAAVLALIDFVLGTVYFDTSSAGRSLAERTSGAAPSASPPPAAADEVFAFGLETFLVGLERRAGAEPDPDD